MWSFSARCMGACNMLFVGAYARGRPTSRSLTCTIFRWTAVNDNWALTR